MSLPSDHRTRIKICGLTREADVIDATGGDVDLDSGGETRCEAGYRCFRVRLISKKANAVWNGDADNDEAICARS